MSVWIPILICTHATLCTGKPIEAQAQPSKQACQDVLSLARSFYIDDAEKHGFGQYATDDFMKKYIVSKCEER